MRKNTIFLLIDNKRNDTFTFIPTYMGILSYIKHKHKNIWYMSYSDRSYHHYMTVVNPYLSKYCLDLMNKNNHLSLC